jgi:Phage integrase central domain/Arm DNA-binding domain/C-terminal region of aryl-sulfatase
MRYRASRYLSTLGGLYLQITAAGTKSWIFRYERGGGNGKRGSEKMMGLGPVHTVSLAQARELATNARKLLLDGRDPLELKRSEKAAASLKAATSITFGECAERLIASHEKVWRNEKHRRQWRSSLLRYAVPLMPLEIAEVETQDVLNVLQPIWTSKVETAKRLRGRIERILDWATASGYRSGENPARLRGNLSHFLPKQTRRVKHHGALPYPEVPALLDRQSDHSNRNDFLYYYESDIKAVRVGPWKLHFATSKNYYDIYQPQKFPIIYNIRMDPFESYDEIADRSAAVQRKQWLNEPVQEILAEHIKSLQEHPPVQAAPTLNFSEIMKQMQTGAN